MGESKWVWQENRYVKAFLISPYLYRKSGVMPQFFAPQPFAQIGVETDEFMRPLDPACGQVVWDNVHVVGRMLAHWDPWTQRCGGGVSVTSGYAAAELI